MVVEETVSKWVREQSVLMSGCTGFLGQALLHKLLKLGCPRVYVLIRPKQNQEASQRLEELLNLEVFKSLIETDSTLKIKVIPISFDSSVPGLDIADKDLEILLNEVTAVFHEAASVRFDDSLNKAILTNVRVTRDLLVLAKEMKKLQVFHHVSTAYSYFQPEVVHHIEEKVFDPKMDWRKAIEAAETVSPKEMNLLEKKILAGFPNTYTFTKHIAESLVHDFEVYFPIVISRPTVVYPAWKEPKPGWVCNLNSPVAIAYGVFKGIIRVVHTRAESRTSYIHIDYVTNLTIVSSWHKAAIDGSKAVAVYNSHCHDMSIKESMEHNESMRDTSTCTNALWYPFLLSVNNPQIFLLAHLVLHFIPGLIVDGLLKCTGGKPRLTRIYRKLYNTSIVLNPFQTYEPTFATERTEKMLEQLPTTDEKYFCFLIPTCRADWLNAYKLQMIKEIKGLMNEPKEPSQADRMHLQRLYIMHMALKTSLILLGLWYFPYIWLFHSALNILSVFFVFDDIKLLSTLA